MGKEERNLATSRGWSQRSSGERLVGKEGHSKRWGVVCWEDLHSGQEGSWVGSILER